MRADGVSKSLTHSVLVVQDASLSAAGLEGGSVALGFSDSLILNGEAATATNVLGVLARYDVLHCCCHARGEPFDPTRSALLMPDGSSIELANVFQLSPGDTRLAVLSVCEGGMRGEALPDEAISIATGLLEAGIHSVIASDWIVDDETGALLMIHFYYLWRHQRRPPTRALHEAQTWLRDSTNAAKVDQVADYPVGCIDEEARRHLLERLQARPRDERSFEHPFHWAAFKWTGAVSV
jgi:CHAT domain-containing protein